MKPKYYLSLALIFYSLIASSQTTIVGSIISGGIVRTYRMYIPAIYNSANPVPLVFNFHGYGSNSIQQEAYGDFRPIADTANFIIVHPQGLDIGGGAGWNCFGTIASGAADYNFVANLIDTISSQYNINQNKIYCTGMSNGGFMSYDMACFLSTRFAAIASVSGSMIALHLTSCNASHPTPIMEIHGTADPVVTYTGIGGIVTCTHIDSLVKFWVNFNNCNPSPVFTALPDINLIDGCTAEHYVYSGGNNNSTVEFYKIIGGGHSWPGSPYPTSNGNTNQDFQASKEIWRFFSQYSLNSLINIKENQQEKPNIVIYPNPAQDKITIICESATPQSYVVSIKNIQGQLLLTNKIEIYKTLSLDLSKFSNGIYFLTLQNEKENFVSKLVLQH